MAVVINTKNFCRALVSFSSKIIDLDGGARFTQYESSGTAERPHERILQDSPLHHVQIDSIGLVLDAAERKDVPLFRGSLEFLDELLRSSEKSNEQIHERPQNKTFVAISP